MTRALFILAAATAVFGFGTLPALAQTRVFVSGQGSDANPCSLAAPCRSFQQAHNTVLAGGEIVALSAAGYGALTISKAVTITAIGIEASITTNSTTTTGITINAGATATVTIRGLTLISGFTSGNGIDIKSAKSVTIRDCSISGFPGDGIFVEPSSDLDVELSGIAASGNVFEGLDIEPNGGNLTLLVTDSAFNGNGQSGVFVWGGNSTGTLSATLSLAAAANGHDGIFVSTDIGQTQPVVMITGAKLVNNVQGLECFHSVQVFVDRTQITGNGGFGWQASGGAVVDSYKNNAVNGNGSDALNGVTQISSE